MRLRQHDDDIAGSRASPWLGVLGGIALGALAMYLSDPEMGRRRRRTVLDSARDLGGRSGEVMGSVLRTAGDRVGDWQAGATRLLGQQPVKPLDDHVLEARVRSRISRVLAHTEQVVVKARAGVVTLSGMVTPEEKRRLLEMAREIPGVDALRDRLDDGEGGHPMARSLAEHRTPIAMAAALAGAGLLGYYLFVRAEPETPRARSTAAESGGTGAGPGVAAALLGFLAGRLRRLDLAGVLRRSTHATPIAFERSIHIQARPETVFDVWSRIENFPRFMSHVREVRDLGGGRSQWVVQGPAGAAVTWNAVLTESRRPHAIAWRSEPDALVPNSGSVQIEPLEGGALVTVRLQWSPPAGMLGRGLAMLLDSDPERQLEDDLLDMKRYVERGVPRQDVSEASAVSGRLLH